MDKCFWDVLTHTWKPRATLYNPDEPRFREVAPGDKAPVAGAKTQCMAADNFTVLTGNNAAGKAQCWPWKLAGKKLGEDDGLAVYLWLSAEPSMV